MDNQILIHLEDDLSESEQIKILEYIEANGYSKIGQLPKLNTINIKVNSNDEISTVIDELKVFPFILNAFPNGILEPAECSQPIDPPNTGNWPLEMGFWDKDTEDGAWPKICNAKGKIGDASVFIGMVEGYVDIDSRYFAENHISPIIYDDAYEPEDESPHHGTSVASLLVANGRVNTEMCGVAWECSLLTYDAQNKRVKLMFKMLFLVSKKL